MNPQIDAYLADGCGRCKLYATPDCKVHKWPNELRLLRSMVLGCGLVEELKWSMPCYTLRGKNVLMLFAFKDCCAISFFKGSLLTDPWGMLQLPGENSHEGRLVRFASVKQILAQEAELRTLIYEAIAVEEAGLKVPRRAATALILPTELDTLLNSDPALREAWTALTPGRQRSHVLHISGAKQAVTRENRAAKCIPAIMSGRGWNEYL